VLPATAALTFLVALSLLGIGILWRWTRLDAIESIAYGAVFGVVMGSTALVPLASWLGLTVPLVVGLGLASAVAGLIADGLVDGPSALRPRRVVLTRRGRLLADTVVRRLLGV